MLSKERIKRYREIAKKIGLWDASYQSIKNDIPAIKSKIHLQDYCLDMLGGTCEQFKLIARVLVYGDSDESLSEDDLKVLFEPLEFFDDFTYIANALSENISDIVRKIIPLIFSLMEASDDIDDYEKTLRSTMGSNGTLADFALAYGIGMSMCFSKYPDMRQYYKFFCSLMTKALDKSKGIKDLIDTVNKNHPTDDVDYYMFSTLFSTMIVECNLNNAISLDRMEELMDKINHVAPKEMRDFINDDAEFKLFNKAIDEYYELSD